MENTVITYSKLINYPALKTNAVTLSKFINTFPIECEYNIEDKATLLGIEVEVENLPHAPSMEPFWQPTEDGSLRNYGREYISLPLRANTVEYALRYLFRTLKNFEYKFSPRCSIHVHMNVRTMTPEQVYHLILIYLLFEKQIFNWIGHDRDKNIHCVPLSETILVSQLRYCLSDGFDSWHKYTALNVLPISKRGTIEFRHMHGTDNIKKLMTWINIILKLKMFVYKNENIEESLQKLFMLNSTSQYRQFAYSVFGKEITDELLDSPVYMLNMEQGVSFAKRLHLDRFNIPLLKKGTMFAKLTSLKNKPVGLNKPELGPQLNSAATNWLTLNDSVSIQENNF